MSPSLSDFFSGVQQAAAAATQAREMKGRRKTNDGRRIYRIACLGHANSGKTTFWTVLEGATKNSSDQFNLQSGDNATAAYLMRQVESMEQGEQWSPGDDVVVGESPGVYEPGYPAQTDLVAELLFMARPPGKHELPILVQDYPGGSVAVEDLEGGSVSVAEFLKSADGILFFVDGIVTRLARVSIDQQLAAFRSLLRHIEDRHGKIGKPVGLVFTKADTLPGFRKGVPAALLQPSDLRRRNEPFSKFLEQLLRGGPYVQDPAWRERVNKTMSRVQSFADTLLKKCASPQFFFVSAVGHRRRRPIEASIDLDGSIVSSRVGRAPGQSFVLGKHQAGLAAPVEWMVNELAVMTIVNRAHRIRNRALRIAATWSILVSLIFMTYLGCETGAVARDFRVSPIPAEKALHDVYRFEHGPYARLWNLLDPNGFMATAREGRNALANRVRHSAEDSLELLLSDPGAGSVQEGPVFAARCSEWSRALKECSKALPETTDESRYKVDALKIQCLGRLCDDLSRAFLTQGMDERKRALNVLPEVHKLCMADGVKSAIDRLVRKVLDAKVNPPEPSLDSAATVQVNSIVEGGTPPYRRVWIGEGTSFPDNATSIMVEIPGSYRLQVTDTTGAYKEVAFIVRAPTRALSVRYNEVLIKYAAILGDPVTRLNRELIGDLVRIEPHATPDDFPSQEAAKRISGFLKEARKFVDGVSLELKIEKLSNPARLKLEGVSPGKPYVEGASVPIADWRLGTKVTFRIVMDNKSIPLPIENLLTEQDKLILVPGLIDADGQSVSLVYLIINPALYQIPSLEPIK